MADTDGGAFAIVDFVGSEATFAFAQAALRRGGRIVIVGLFGGGMSMPLPMFPMRAITIGGSYVGSPTEAREMLDLVKAGKVAPIPVRRRAPARQRLGRSLGRPARRQRFVGRVSVDHAMTGKPLKITVIGPGGVGGYFGARLAAAGNDVTFVARGAHLDGNAQGRPAPRQRDRSRCT